jgi:hypothetical protein
MRSSDKRAVAAVTVSDAIPQSYQYACRPLPPKPPPRWTAQWRFLQEWEPFHFYCSAAAAAWVLALNLFTGRAPHRLFAVTFFASSCRRSAVVACRLPSDASRYCATFVGSKEQDTFARQAVEQSEQSLIIW